MTLRISAAHGTDLHVGEPDRPLQLVRVEIEGADGRHLEVRVAGPRGAEGPISVARAEEHAVVLVPAELGGRAGDDVPVTVNVDVEGERIEEQHLVTASEPGWTVHMVSHFHYDPVWWNSQANFTDEWPERVRKHHPHLDFQGAAFDVVDAHLDLAEREAEYRFVLAELDYLKPYWDSRPHRRGLIRRLLAEGRLELVGGTYNEPNTNLSSPEATLRNAVYGMAFQRLVLGGDPRTTWQLDVFGHDPSYPSLMAAAGLCNTSWARGPFHQNGPTYDYGPAYAPFFHREGPFRNPAELADATRMQFPSEFEWVSPDGVGLPTAYMTGHYIGGWRFDSAEDLETAGWSAFALFEQLRPVAATRQVLLPVGTDFARPNRWIIDLAEDWNKRYLSPRFVISTPRQFFAALDEELAFESRSLLPQTRDMNPVWTGKDVSLIDTKRAQRRIESRLGVAEMLATVASSLGAPYPLEALDLAWRQALFGAHHDAVTGTCSDQVFVDLLGSWRNADELVERVTGDAMSVIAGEFDTSGMARAIVVFNPEPWERTEVVTVELGTAPGEGWQLSDAAGAAVPAVLEGRPDLPGARLRFVAALPAGGAATFSLAERSPADASTGDLAVARPAAGDLNRPEALGDAAGAWRPIAGTSIDNEHFSVVGDPAAGGGLTSVVHVSSGRELVRPGQTANEVVCYGEYADHPTLHEGPWHLSPDGQAERASLTQAEVVAERSAAGERLVVRGRLSTLAYEQTVTLWKGLDRIDVVTRIDDFTGSDQLVRVLFPFDLPGGLPLAEAGQSVVGRSFGFPAVDTAHGSWTLDTPAYRFAGLGTTASVLLRGGGGADAVAGTSSTPAAGVAAVPNGERRHSIGVGEVVLPDTSCGPAVRDLVVALARVGVTSTTSTAQGTRYGALELDSNLPDFRLTLGGPEENAFTGQVAATLDVQATEELRGLLAAGEPVWVPAARDVRELLGPNADLRSARDLPVLVVPLGAATLAETCARLVADLEDATIEGRLLASLPDHAAVADGFTAAVVNTGTPGFAVDIDGTFHLSLMRSCTGWPSGVWVDEPARPSPDGSAYHLSHWSHSFEYALLAGPGDWRQLELPARASEVNRPPVAREVEPGGGSLPGDHSFYAVSPARRVLLSALKLSGNPHAEGRDASSVAEPSVSFRLYAAGTASTASLADGMGLGTAFAWDALETEHGEALDAQRLELGAWQLATVGARLPAEHLPTVPEASTPVYARYWMHNAGAAPAGFVPVSLHLEPRELAIGTEPGVVQLSVSSDRTDARVHRQITLEVPDGVELSARTFEVDLDPGETWTGELRLFAPGDLPLGVHYLKASARDELDRVLEDTVRLVAVDGGTPGHDHDRVSHPDLVVEVQEGPVRVVAGGRTSVRVELENRTRSAIDCMIDAVAPVDAWAVLPVPTISLQVSAGERVSVEVPVEAGAACPPGRWWLLVKSTWYGQRSYARALPLEVLP